MTTGWWRLGWLFNRRVALVLLCAVLLVSAAIIANLVGIGLAGNVERWRQWLDAHAIYFFAWRVLLYAATAYGWVWMRRRLLVREPNARPRLLRMEIGAVLAMAALEFSQIVGMG